MADRWSRALVAALLLLIALFALTVERNRGPAPKSFNAPPDEFSAARAGKIREQILGDGAPHPAGSAANRRVRDRIVEQLRSIGYAPIVDRRWECYGWAECAEVENIMARLEGSGGREAVLLVAHYDSVGSGPGASDDGGGVAALLEIARILKRERPRNPVIFLIDDGEEAGLIGAAAFERQHPWAKEVATVVNLEARGSSGASYLFEASRNNRWLVDLVARHVPRPATSSLYYSIYERLPNDTDFTVFKSAGYAGVNFAHVGDVQHYHTPRDNAANASLRSLQHHGDNALGMARAFAMSAPIAEGRGNAVFFDFFSLDVIRWPETWTVGFLLLDVLLLIAALVVVRRRGVTLAQMLWGIVFSILSLIIAILVAVAGGAILRAAGAVPSAWVAYPVALLAFFWIGGLAASCLTASLFARRATVWGLWSGTAFMWTALASVFSILLSGGAFLFLVPSLAIKICGIVFARRFETLSFVIPVAVAGAIVFPTAWPLYAGMGLPLMTIVAILIAAATLPAAAILGATARRMRAVSLTFLGIFVLSSLMTAALLPPFSGERPRRLSVLLHHDADTKMTQWLIPGDEGPLPDAVQRAARWHPQRVNPFPWFPTRGYFTAPAPAMDAALPEITVQREPGKIRVRLVPQGRPSKAALMLRDPKMIESVSVNGRMTTRRSGRRASGSTEWLRIALHTVPEGTTEIEIVQRGTSSIEAIVEQRWFGLPPAASPITTSRGATAVPSQEGDVTVVTKRVPTNPHSRPETGRE